MAAAAVLGGARSMAAIAEWAADAPELIRVALGARRDGPAHCVVPSEATIRHTLARLDAETLAEVIGFQPLLADLDLAGAVVTADALHAHAGAAKFLVTTKACGLPVHRQSQPAHPAEPMCPAGLAAGACAGPAPATAPTAGWRSAP
jgi:hypothetical protein